MSGLVFTCPQCGSDLDEPYAPECHVCGAFTDPASMDDDYDRDHQETPDAR